RPLLATRIGTILDRQARVIHDARRVRDELLIEPRDLALEDRRYLAIENDLREPRIGRHIREIARNAAELLPDLDHDRGRHLLRAHGRDVVEGGDRPLEDVDARDVGDRGDELNDLTIVDRILAL